MIYESVVDQGIVQQHVLKGLKNVKRDDGELPVTPTGGAETSATS